MKGFLAELYPQKIAEVEFLKTNSLSGVDKQRAFVSEQDMPVQPFKQALQLPRLQIHGMEHEAEVSIVAEIKPASPSMGDISTKDPFAILTEYEHFASALSVLTDMRFFKGSFELLAAIAAKTRLPVLCKDFIIDPFQIENAKNCGASAVLLIVKLLDRERLLNFYSLVRSLGMTPVVEIQTESELAQAVDLGAEVILINNRNLETLEVSLETTSKLAPLVPQEITVISASGIQRAEDMLLLHKYSKTFLVGTALMQCETPSSLFRLDKDEALAL